MRTPIRALLAATVSLAALSIAAATASSAAAPPAVLEHTPAPGGVGATCVIQHPDCNDRLIGAGGSEPGSSGSSGDDTLPPTGAPSPGCGQDVASGSGPDGVVSNVPCEPGGPLPEPRPQIVAPRAGMAGVRPIGFDTATIRPDDRTLDVTFWSGVEPCAVLDHVDVSYGPDAVTVTLFQGSDPTAGLVACPEIAVLKQVTVTLDQDLAGRRIIDGVK
jgi:hypothetical protein